MGSPISVVIAELVMQNIEAKIFQNDAFDILLWRRYVDDCFVIVRNDQIDPLLSFINSINDNIKFTCELEQNSKLPFLDLLIMRNNDGSLNFTVYRKPTNSGKYLDFCSYSHHSHKMSVIRSLV